MENKQQTDNPQTLKPSISSDPHHFPKTLLLGLGAFLIVIIGAGIGYFLGVNNQTSQVTYDTPNINPSETSIPQVFPSPELPNVEKAKLSNMDNWKNESIDQLYIKIPPMATISKGFCEEGYENCYLITKHDSSLLAPPHITVKIKPYKGGSRRQEAGLELPLTDYTFKEKTFGATLGLEAINNCKISQCTSLREIIIVVGNKLIRITDGIYKSDSSARLESPITNTIIASIASAISKNDIKVGWKTYTDSSYGYKIQYPPEWTLTQDKDSEGDARIELTALNATALDISRKAPQLYISITSPFSTAGVAVANTLGGPADPLEVTINGAQQSIPVIRVEHAKDGAIGGERVFDFYTFLFPLPGKKVSSPSFTDPVSLVATMVPLNVIASYKTIEEGQTISGILSTLTY